MRRSFHSSTSLPLTACIMDNWADLPQDLVAMISELLIPSASIRMQSVCKSWQRILKNNRPPRITMVDDPQHELGSDACDFFSVSKQKFHTIHLPEMHGKRCYGSFNKEEKRDLRLFHPWSRRELKLPRVCYQGKIEGGKYSLIKYSMGSSIPSIHIHRAALSDDGNTVVAITRD